MNASKNTRQGQLASVLHKSARLQLSPFATQQNAMPSFVSPQSPLSNLSYQQSYSSSSDSFGYWKMNQFYRFKYFLFKYAQSVIKKGIATQKNCIFWCFLNHFPLPGNLASSSKIINKCISDMLSMLSSFSCITLWQTLQNWRSKIFFSLFPFYNIFTFCFHADVSFWCIWFRRELTKHIM